MNAINFKKYIKDTPGEELKKIETNMYLFTDTFTVRTSNCIRCSVPSICYYTMARRYSRGRKYLLF